MTIKLDIDFSALAENAATTIMEIQRGETRCFLTNADLILDVLEWFGLRVDFRMWEKNSVSYYSLRLDDREDCYLGSYLATWGGEQA